MTIIKNTPAVQVLDLFTGEVAEELAEVNHDALLQRDYALDVADQDWLLQAGKDAAVSQSKKAVADKAARRFSYVRRILAISQGIGGFSPEMTVCSATLKPGRDEPGHVMMFAGPAGDPGTMKHHGCENPNLFSCRYCSYSYLGECKTRSKGKCEPCSTRYKKRVRAIARMPILWAAPKSVLFVTLTAPGATKHCRRHTYEDPRRPGKILPSIKCVLREDQSDCDWCPCGDNPLREGDDAAFAKFNSACSRMWSDFVTYLRREKSLPMFAGFEYLRVAESQRRGALHFHALVRLKKAARITQTDLKRIQEIAVGLGFGHEVDVQVLPEGDDKIKAARYVAKYVSKAYEGFEVPFETVWSDSWLRRVESTTAARSQQLDDFVWLDGGSPAPEEGFVRVTRARKRRPRVWTASRKWGLSMRLVENQQVLFACGYEKEAKALIDGAQESVREHQDLPPDGVAA